MPQVINSSTTIPRVGKAVLFATTEVLFLTHIAQSTAGPSFSVPGTHLCFWTLDFLPADLAELLSTSIFIAI